MKIERQLQQKIIVCVDELCKSPTHMVRTDYTDANFYRFIVFSCMLVFLSPVFFATWFLRSLGRSLPNFATYSMVTGIYKGRSPRNLPAQNIKTFGAILDIFPTSPERNKISFVVKRWMVVVVRGGVGAGRLLVSSDARCPLTRLKPNKKWMPARPLVMTACLRHGYDSSPVIRTPVW